MNLSNQMSNAPEGGLRALFCADKTEKCSVNTEEKITEENCREEIIIGKTGTECATGPHTGGKM